ncbi:polyprenyl synthetase family protein [Novosphingobium terrae]|uniref:polyprenyl synthetase family protein n=1 Tax=Novosphingobium terrae TaxID=2726189 RepID=UPI001981F444|nr:farnesyl diphosphate synthase [Novosphingobium terrae]
MSGQHSGEAKPGEEENAASRPTELRRDIDAVIDQAIGTSPSRHQRLADAMRYAALGAGKRFRAMLVIAVSDLLGARRGGALRVAAAIECVHAQSLVHDDLPCMDDDDLRRGKPTLHRAFDEATAVLAGDALLALAFEILSDPRTHPEAAVRGDLVLKLARTMGQDGLAGGQMLDLFPGDQISSEAMILCEMRKTGALIRYCVEAAAILAGCDDGQRRKLMSFAEKLGLMFQIRDDILDMSGDEKLVGKGLRKDTAQGKNTATACLGLEDANLSAAHLERDCHEALIGFGSQASALHDLAAFAFQRMH